jgi:hypothetical protein
MMVKVIFKKSKRREKFKPKKSVYLQAKAAYCACLLDSDEDEDSNKSFSDYSSEGSNVS